MVILSQTSKSPQKRLCLILALLGNETCLPCVARKLSSAGEETANLVIHESLSRKFVCLSTMCMLQRERAGEQRGASKLMRSNGTRQTPEERRSECFLCSSFLILTSHCGKNYPSFMSDSTGFFLFCVSFLSNIDPTFDASSPCPACSWSEYRELHYDRAVAVSEE